MGYLDLLRKGKVKDPVVQSQFLTGTSQEVDRLIDLVMV